MGTSAFLLEMRPVSVDRLEISPALDRPTELGPIALMVLWHLRQVSMRKGKVRTCLFEVFSDSTPPVTPPAIKAPIINAHRIPSRIENTLLLIPQSFFSCKSEEVQALRLPKLTTGSSLAPERVLSAAWSDSGLLSSPPGSGSLAVETTSSPLKVSIRASSLEIASFSKLAEQDLYYIPSKKTS